MKPIWKLILPAVVVLGGLIRFTFFLEPSLWADEGLFIRVALADHLAEIPSLYGQTATDQPLGTFLLLLVWRHLAGATPAAFRMFPVVVSTLAIWSIGWAAWKATRDSWVVCTAMLLMALSPFAIRYGYDISPYSLLNLLISISLGLVFKRIRDGHSPWTLGLLLINAALLNTHYFAYFYVAALSLVLLWMRRKNWRDDVRSVVLSLGGYGMASVPIAFLLKPDRIGANHAWLGGRSIVGIVGNLFAYTLWAQVLLCLSVVAAATYGAIRWKKVTADYKALFLVIGGTVGVFLTLAFGVELLVGPLVAHERYLMTIFPCLVLGTAALFRSATTFSSAGLIPGVAAISLLPVAIWIGQPRESLQDFNRATDLIRTYATSSGSDILVVPECCRWTLNYYIWTKGVDIQTRAAHLDALIKTDDYLDFLLRDTHITSDQKIFLVLYYGSLEAEAQLRARFDRGHRMVGAWHLTGVTVLQYRKEP